MINLEPDPAPKIDQKSLQSPQRKSRLQLWASVTIPVLTAVLAMVGALAATIVTQREKAVTESKIADALRQREIINQILAESKDTRLELTETQARVDAIQHTMDSATKSGKTPQYGLLSPTDRQSLDQIKADQAQLRTRLSGLETALMTTPDKALAVPMLKQQLDILQDRTHSDLDSIRGEIGRLFTLTQWFIGLMFTIAIGVFGLALSNIRRPKGKSVLEE